MRVTAWNHKKSSLNSQFLDFKVVQGHQCWYPRNCGKVINSAYYDICNRSRARLVDSSRNRAFWRKYKNFMPSYGGLLEARKSKLILLISTFNAKKFYTQLISVYLQWFRLNLLLTCVSQPKITKHSLNSLFLGFKVVQGHSRFNVSPPGKLVKLVMTSSKSVSICNRSHAIVKLTAIT